MITFFSDPHLGVRRSANTTATSSENLRDRLFRAAMDVLHVNAGNTIVCAGDVFDSYSNKEEVIAQGVQVVSRCWAAMAGNHDVTNRQGQVGSLALIDDVLSAEHAPDLGVAVTGPWIGNSPVVSLPFGEAGYEVAQTGDTIIRMIPHTATQTLFEESINSAYVDAGKCGGYKQVLVLHCNFNMSEERLNETTLNLSYDLAKSLVDRFNYVILGHEHNPSDHFGGRLVVLGNLHPTGMADLSDKRIAHYNPSTGTMKFEQIWSLEQGYDEYRYDQIPAQTGASFVKIVGEAPAGAMVEVSKSIATLWDRSPSLYCVKSEVTIPSVSMTPQEEDGVESKYRLPELVRSDLSDKPNLLSLWDELVEEVQGA